MAEIDPVKAMEKLRETHENSLPKCVKCEPYCKNGIQYEIKVIEIINVYETRVYCNGEKVGDTIQMPDTDLYLSSTLNKDNSFFERYISIAKNKIDTGEIVYNANIN